MDGDVIQLPNSLSPSYSLFDNTYRNLEAFLVLTCVHIWKQRPEKLTLFEPTPPLHPAHKVFSYVGLILR